MSVVHKLQEPITLTFTGSSTGIAGDREEKMDSVTIRKPKAKDLRAIDAVTGDVAKSIALMARLTGLTVATVDEMDVTDFQAIGDIIEGFTQPGRPTGETS